jgi:hypothetical protein
MAKAAYEQLTGRNAKSINVHLINPEPIIAGQFTTAFAAA